MGGADGISFDMPLDRPEEGPRLAFGDFSFPIITAKAAALADGLECLSGGKFGGAALGGREGDDSPSRECRPIASAPGPTSRDDILGFEGGGPGGGAAVSSTYLDSLSP